MYAQYKFMAAGTLANATGRTALAATGHSSRMDFGKSTRFPRRNFGICVVFADKLTDNQAFYAEVRFLWG